MEFSLLVMQILSIIYIASGLGILLGSIDFNRIVEDFQSSPALTFVSGCVGTGLGIIIIKNHNLWVLQWTLLVTLIGWAFLVGGFLVVIAPQFLFYLNRFYKSSKYWGIIMILVGGGAGYRVFLEYIDKL